MGEFEGHESMETYLEDLLNETCTDVKLDNSNYEEEEEEEDNSGDSARRKPEKRPLSNRQAVRRYREKKKARAASLEEEVVKLRSVNEQLARRLQSQSALEAEAVRLKCLLVDIRGRIEAEIGSFPYQKPLGL
ncbi:hypothetical protein V2J09_000095 [Rumex salicifolius]